MKLDNMPDAVFADHVGPRLDARNLAALSVASRGVRAMASLEREKPHRQREVALKSLEFQVSKAVTQVLDYLSTWNDTHLRTWTRFTKPTYQRPRKPHTGQLQKTLTYPKPLKMVLKRSQTLHADVIQTDVYLMASTGEILSWIHVEQKPRPQPQRPGRSGMWGRRRPQGLSHGPLTWTPRTHSLWARSVSLNDRLTIFTTDFANFVPVAERISRRERDDISNAACKGVRSAIARQPLARGWWTHKLRQCINAPNFSFVTEFPVLR